MDNPYAAPKTALAETDESSLQIKRVVSGQKFMISALGLYLLLIGAYAVIAAQDAGKVTVEALSIASLVVPVCCLVLAIIGILKVGAGMGRSRLARAFHVFCLFLPTINLIILLVINARATRFLKQAGYSVGLFGARG
ncbi:hypothetical protein LRS11_13380 [Pseudomonas sp. J452]|uniref:hypothetical protein n=1 Tax=Pseudomonas sp. J452 TaxID=2898441 RepID=UPI0021AD6BBC|nr:hypothetical protein [Pseudomonas sp. J452]UUY06839.1 hypothetical protein LRS11_13380 [Pseudomonas sp. J452]